MPRESEIRKKAVQILEREKWLVWWPAKVKFKQTDIFGLFDLICWKKKAGNFKLIQLTTLPNLSTRRKKIQNFLQKYKIDSNGARGVKTEIWAWGKSKKVFKIEIIKASQRG